MPQKIEKDKQYYLDEELLLVRNSGEIPEVAYHGSLYYLSKDPDGPRLVLSESDLLPLKKAVFERYRRILLRDLNPKLRNKGVYRGLLRCIANWERFCTFCTREGFDPHATRLELQGALLAFLTRELEDFLQGSAPSINCSAKALSAFVESLGLDRDSLPENWQNLCVTSS